MKYFGFLFVIIFTFSAQAQSFQKDFDLKENGRVEVTNHFGKVYVEADEAQKDKVLLIAQGKKKFSESAIKTSGGSKVRIEVEPGDLDARIDLTLKVPIHTRLTIETREGEVMIEGGIDSADVLTYSGTIATNIPLDSVKYNFLWTASRPRYLSDVELPKDVEEKSAGRFGLSGKLGEAAEKKKKEDKAIAPSSEEDASEEPAPVEGEKKDEPSKKGKKEKKKKLKSYGPIDLNFTTARGIILLNVNQAEVPSDLRERPLTEAARAIIRSGDSLLMEAIRRASPKYFGDYARTLPPRRATPTITEKTKAESKSNSQIKRVYVKVMDSNNRAVAGLTKENFSLSEKGTEREILDVQQTNAPFNLVLLLDVSGSIQNYVDFIRKAARNFVNTMRPDDKISIIVFNEQVKQLVTFTANRGILSESLDTFDAGGGTAYYDAIAYCLVETLKPLRGERTGIVILSDGDDNHSFLPFEALVASVQESGALIYPLYVPSALVAASATSDPKNSTDPLRTRYMGLTTRAEDEGSRLAHASGGVYYPITRLDQLQKAYEDIAVQLRTSYLVTFRSDIEVGPDKRVGPRLKVKVNKENTFVNLGAISEVTGAEAAKYEKKETSQNTQP